MTTIDTVKAQPHCALGFTYGYGIHADAFSFSNAWCIVVRVPDCSPVNGYEIVETALKIIVPAYGSIALSKADLGVEQVPAHERQAVLREAAIAELLGKCEVSISDASVAQRVEQMVANFKIRLSGSGVDFAGYLVDIGRSEETLREQLRDIATEAIKKEAVLWHIAHAEGISVEPAELDERVRQIALLSGADPDETRGCLGRMPFLAQEILFDKVSDFLVERYFRE